MNKPNLSYHLPTHQWRYTNGCVVRNLDSLELAKEKLLNFEEHPRRHTDYWSKHSKCLGVDVPYDAWEEPEFEPLQITITLENEKQMEALHAVFNYTPVCEYLRSHGISPDAIRDFFSQRSFNRYGEQISFVNYVKKFIK